jgi:ankyrin repeat protein
MRVAAALLDHGAHAHAQDLNGDTPLHVAASQHYDELVALLLRAQPPQLELTNARGEVS